MDMNVLRKILRTLFGTTTEPTSTVSDIDRILKATTEVTGVTLIQMQSKRRVKEYTHARHIAMYLACEMTNMSMPQIGRKMNRDHTTVYYALEKISNRGRGATKLNKDLAKIKQLAA